MTRAPLVRGFTLLEVVVALAILALGLMAVSDVAGNALRNHLRAHELDVATLLARGKLAELEDRFDEEGFRDFDQDEDGTFEAQGHPEVRWAFHVKKPALEGGGDAACTKLVGDAFTKFVPSSASGSTPSASSPTGPSNPILDAINAAVKAQCTSFTELMKKGVRELTLRVAWGAGKAETSFDVTTHLVVLTPRKGQP